MDLRNSNGIELLYNRIEAFLENFHKEWKNTSCETQFRYFQSKHSFSDTFEDSNLRESYAKLHKNRVKLWEQIGFKGYKSVSTVFLGTLTDFRCILHSVRLRK